MPQGGYGYGMQQGRTAQGYMPCPSCGGVMGNMPSYTWWGGWLGPKMFTHVVCPCGTGYNGKSGKDNKTAIGIYVGVSVVLALILVAAQF